MEKVKSGDPFLAFAFFLCTLLSATLITLFIGNATGLSLVHYAMLLALLPTLWLTHDYFLLSGRKLFTCIGLALLLGVLGFISAHIVDKTHDSVVYHKPLVNLILNGWNPLHADASLTLHNIYPSGAWAVGAALSIVYKTAEAAKALQLWWICITLPVLLAGFRNLLGDLKFHQSLLVVLLVLNPIVIGQHLTHYVDGLVYLEGMMFVGALLLYGASPRQNRIACMLMAMGLLFIINTKLSGIYYAAMLCAGAVIHLSFMQKKFAWEMAAFLFITSIVCTVIFGFQPYVTSMMRYHGSLLPWSMSLIVSEIRPPNLTPFSLPTRFFYSIFSQTGGGIPVDAVLKWPWTIHGNEWIDAGLFGTICAGFGPLFALGLCVTALSFATYGAVSRKKATHEPMHQGPIIIALLMLIFSMFFPEGWWARYAPFGYAVPLLCLLALPPSSSRLWAYPALLIFLANDAIAFHAFYGIIIFRTHSF